jgi:hypothetical protein
MMDAVGRERGLIRYASENGIGEGKKLRYTGRMKFYTAILVLLLGVLVALLVSRKDVDGTILRAGGMLYQERGKDSVSNLYNIKVINKSLKDISVKLELEGMPGNIIEAEGRNIEVKREGQGKGAFFIVLPRNSISERKTKLKVALYDDQGNRITSFKTTFLGPVGRE